MKNLKKVFTAGKTRGLLPDLVSLSIRFNYLSIVFGVFAGAEHPLQLFLTPRAHLVGRSPTSSYFP